MRRYKVFFRVLIFTGFLALGGMFYPFSALAIFIDDFLINSDLQKNSDDFPFVAVDGKGNFTVIWINYCYDPVREPSYYCGRVYMKHYDSNGNLLTPSVPLTPESRMVLNPAHIAMHPSGSFVLAWTDNTSWIDSSYKAVHVFAQRFDSLVNPIGELIRVDQNPLDSVAAVWDVEMDNNNNFVIVWIEGGGGKIFARKFLSDGTPAGPPFAPKLCSTLTCTSSQYPYLDMLPDGYFIIVWYENIVEYNGLVPMGRMYDSNAQPVWSEAKVLTCDDSLYVPHCGGTTGSCLIGNATDVAFNTNGSYMIFTGACDGEPLNNNVYGRLLDSSAQGLTHNFKVNTVNPKTYDLYPRAVSDECGNFFAIWSDARNSYNQGPLDIFVQRYDSLANAIGSNWRVNTPKGSPKFTELAFDISSNGDKVFMVWKDYRDRLPQNDTIKTNIYGQLVDLSQVGFYIPGDLNFDLKVNLTDLIWLVNYVFKGGPPPDPEPWVGDVNADCKVNLTDIIYLVNYVFKGGAAPIQGCAYSERKVAEKFSLTDYVGETKNALDKLSYLLI